MSIISEPGIWAANNEVFPSDGAETSLYNSRVLEVPASQGDILTRVRWALGCQDSTPAHEVVNKFGEQAHNFMVQAGRARLAESCIWDFKYRRN